MEATTPGSRCLYGRTASTGVPAFGEQQGHLGCDVWIRCSGRGRGGSVVPITMGVPVSEERIDGFAGDLGEALIAAPFELVENILAAADLFRQPLAARAGSFHIVLIG